MFFLLSIKRHASNLPMLQLFLSALPDSTLDGTRFVLSHPDFNSQNMLVDRNGTITGIIDWDNVDIHPRQGAVAIYPTWLTVDWDPLFHGWSRGASPKENTGHDSPAGLVTYHRAYLDAITRASRGRFVHITRNSHIWTTLYISLANGIATSGIVDHLSTFVLTAPCLGMM
jgi:aminoglycoside phosphotransferase (APT) family kinase protein